MLNGIIAIASILVALWFGGIEIVELAVSVQVTPAVVSIYLDPVFLVWDEANCIPGSAFAIGNTIVIEERWRGTEREAYLRHHEMIHVRQCQAIGWAMWPAQWFGLLAIEPPHGPPEWAKPEENDARMWVPGKQPRWYHFLEIRVGG
ncbi:MAG: hypothetical protein KAY24_06885 [Candidatus Eisenbacteria sp.]|nr:hypothetical protein [Candidatus Eisenbacteria bacterium]